MSMNSGCCPVVRPNVGWPPWSCIDYDTDGSNMFSVTSICWRSLIRSASGWYSFTLAADAVYGSGDSLMRDLASASRSESSFGLAMSLFGSLSLGTSM